MMVPLLLLSSFIGAASAQQYGYAVDINQPGTPSSFNCLKNSHYSAVFIRVYKPDGSGGVDNSGILNVGPAFNAGLGVEVYMTPNPTSSKSANTQVDEVVKAMKSGGVQLQSVWLLVTSPINWNKYQATNANFIKTVIARFKSYGINVGIYTNHYDWLQITNNMGSLGSFVRLWYWSVYGLGPNAESPPNFSDFRPFGQWTGATVKQFGQFEALCGFTINRNVYPINSCANSTRHHKKKLLTNRIEDESEDTVVVGSIGLGCHDHPVPTKNPKKLLELTASSLFPSTKP